MSFINTSGYYRCIYQKLSIFIKYHSLVGQVNLYICISYIIGVTAESAVSIGGLSYFRGSCKDRIVKPVCLCCLVDSPAVIAAFDGLLTAIICGKGSCTSKSIIFISKIIYIGCYLVLINCIIAFFVFCKPVFDGIAVQLLGAVGKIIGDTQLVSLFIWSQSFLRVLSSLYTEGFL